jgi:hypothetical protein
MHVNERVKNARPDAGAGR